LSGQDGSASAESKRIVKLIRTLQPVAALKG
jgi:hypothetical protein